MIFHRCSRALHDLITQTHGSASLLGEGQAGWSRCRAVGVGSASAADRQYNLGFPYRKQTTTRRDDLALGSLGEEDCLLFSEVGEANTVELRRETTKPRGQLLNGIGINDDDHQPDATDRSPGDAGICGSYPAMTTGSTYDVVPCARSERLVVHAWRMRGSNGRGTRTGKQARRLTMRPGVEDFKHRVPFTLIFKAPILVLYNQLLLRQIVAYYELQE
ncbi:hypothetical protein PSPO01_13089 [Paraphaeosphaeria sporulosa]